MGDTVSQPASQSEFGNMWRSQSHDWLHVGLIELGDNSTIELAILSRIELHLINVTICISNSAWIKSGALGVALS